VTEALRPCAGITRPPFAALTTAADLVRHRALVWALLVRQLKVRYRGSVLGSVDVLHPLLLMAVYRWSSLLHADRGTELCTVSCRRSAAGGSGSVLADEGPTHRRGSSVVTKSLFPTEVLPTVVYWQNMVKLPAQHSVVVVADGSTDRAEPLPWLSLVRDRPAMRFTLAWCGPRALNVHYRDVQHIVSNLLLLWFF